MKPTACSGNAGTCEKLHDRSRMFVQAPLLSALANIPFNNNNNNNKKKHTINLMRLSPFYSLMHFSISVKISRSSAPSGMNGLGERRYGCSNPASRKTHTATGETCGPERTDRHLRSGNLTYNLTTRQIY
jgi:hypothetical protein